MPRKAFMAKTLPTRDQVAPEDTWDLSKMYADRESWEADLKQAREMGKKLADQEGHVCESAQSLLDTKYGASGAGYPPNRFDTPPARGIGDNSPPAWRPPAPESRGCSQSMLSYN